MIDLRTTKHFVWENCKPYGYVWFPEGKKKKMSRKMFFSCLVVLWKIPKKKELNIVRIS